MPKKIMFLKKTIKNQYYTKILEIVHLSVILIFVSFTFMFYIYHRHIIFIFLVCVFLASLAFSCCALYTRTQMFSRLKSESEIIMESIK